MTAHGAPGSRHARDPLTVYEAGLGTVEAQEKRFRLAVGENRGAAYHNAQVDDYHLDATFRWRPPAGFKVRARFSHNARQLCGTAGFGFWNDPFAMTPQGGAGSRLSRYRFPQAIWFFFASEASNIPLAQDVSGNGWKAATLDASSLVAKALLPFAPLGALACRIPALYHAIWPAAQRILKIREAQLSVAMDEWLDYELKWMVNEARWLVDGVEVLRSVYSPRGPLGFVVWIDNQYMIATPQGQIRNGTVGSGQQWLEIASLTFAVG